MRCSNILKQQQAIALMSLRGGALSIIAYRDLSPATFIHDPETSAHLYKTLKYQHCVLQKTKKPEYNCEDQWAVFQGNAKISNFQKFNTLKY